MGAEGNRGENHPGTVVVRVLDGLSLVELDVLVSSEST